VSHASLYLYHNKSNNECNLDSPTLPIVKVQYFQLIFPTTFASDGFPKLGFENHVYNNN